MIEESLTEARKLYGNVDLHIYVHNTYGKRFMKKCKLSPDAYIQMALQLAHYRVSRWICLLLSSLILFFLIGFGSI